ncbi:MAG: polysaccharide biosynthesis C-terminal domain-containing protein [Dokdonella sp.]
MTTRAQAMRNTLFSSVGIYTEYFLGMIVSIVIARHLGPNDFGTYSLVVWLVACGVTATNAGTTTTMIKFIAEVRGGGREDLLHPLIAYLRRAQAMFLGVVLVLGSAAFLLAGGELAPGFNHWMLCGLLVFAVALRAPYMLNIAVAKGFERFGATATIALATTPLNLGMILVAWFMRAPIEVFLGIFAVSSVLFYAISRWQVRGLMPAITTHGALPAELMRRVHRHMRFVAVISTVGFFTASETEVLFLNLLDTPAGAGQFKVAYQLATGAALLLPGVFSAVLLPMMARAFSEGKAVAARRFVASTTYLTLLAAPLVGFGFVFSDATITVLYGPAYHAADIVLTACLLASSITVISNAATSLLVSADQQQSVLARVVGCGVLKIILDILLVGRYGLVGATAAYLVVSIIGAAVTIALALRISEARLHGSRLLRITLAIVIASLLVSPLRALDPPLLAMLGGIAGLGIVYALLTLLLGCWTETDIDYFSSLHQKLLRGRPAALAAFLRWVGLRAAKDIR